MIKNEEKLKKIEETYDWKGAIQLMDNAILNNTLNEELSLRIIFLLAYFCSELPYSKKELEQARQNLIKYIQISDSYLNNPDYLFFSGLSIYLAYFYIGYNDPSEAINRLQKANDLEPENPLYQWGIQFVTNQNIEVEKEIKNKLVNQYYKDNRNYIEFLNTKGTAGKYVLGMLE